MRSLRLRLVIALVQSHAFSMAIPIIPPSLAPRRQHCYNDPTTVAGTLFSAGTPAPPTLSPRHADSPTVIWCTPGSRTYVKIQMLRYVAGPVVSNMLWTAYSAVMAHIYVGNGENDGVISNHGNVNWAEAQGLTLRTWNTNNHQTTYGVLAAAIRALGGYMNGQGFGTVRFTIFDGDNEVGAGTLT